MLVVVGIVEWEHRPTEKSSTTQPALGRPWASNQQGYGQVKPVVVFNGGDPTGLVTGIKWSSWGGSTATGVGTSDYTGQSSSVADGRSEPATIVAFDLGVCDGKLMYQAVEVYFAEYGESFDPTSYINVCTGAYVGNR